VAFGKKNWLSIIFKKFYIVLGVITFRDVAEYIGWANIAITIKETSSLQFAKLVALITYLI